MRTITMIQTDLTPDTAAQLRAVKTQNRKEVVGTCVMFQDPAPDTLPADIRAVWRQAEYLEKLEKTAKTISMMHISGDLGRLINELAVKSK